MKIAIYDTVHEETLATVIRIFSGNEVHVFTTEKFFRVLEKKYMEGVHWHLVDDKTPLGHANEIRKQNEKHHFNYVILSTVHQHHMLFAFLRKPQTKVFIVLHDSNALKPKIKLGMRSLARYAGTHLLNRVTDGFFVLSSEVKNHIINSKLTRKPVIVIPGAVWEEKVSLEEGEDLIITIPGTIDWDRRNYEEIAALAPLLVQDKKKIKFVVLGGNAGDGRISALAEKVRSANPSADMVLFSSAYIPQEEFDLWLKRSHLIYLPLRDSIQKPEGVEYYGKTKISGGFYDAVRFSRIILQPASIPVAEEFRSQVHTYSSVRELAQWINAAIETEGLLTSLQEKANLNASRFELEQVRRSVLTELGAVS